MRVRTIVLIIFIVLVAGFAALNMEEFMRTSVLSLGFATVQVSLGLVMLILLVVVTVVFLGSTVLMQSSNLLETRKYARELNVQRDLADKAETSRFTELRQYFEVRAVEEKERDLIAQQLWVERLAAQDRSIMARLDQTDNTVAAHLGQLEDRFDKNTAVRF